VTARPPLDDDALVLLAYPIVFLAVLILAYPGLAAALLVLAGITYGVARSALCTPA